MNEEVRASVSEEKPSAAVWLSKTALAAYVFALFWMKTPLWLNGMPAIVCDLVYLVAAAAWLVAFVTGRTKLHWHPAFWLLILYFAAMLLSGMFSPDPRTSAIKLATQLYLLSLPVLVFNLVRTSSDFRRMSVAWLAGSGIVATIGVGTLLLFPFFGWNSFLAAPLHNFGTLPAGLYPRLETTFLLPSIMVNYLTVSLVLLILSYRLGWIARTPAIVLGVSIWLTALFGLTPGFGGLMAMLAAWLWYDWRADKPNFARLSLAAAFGFTLLMVVVASFTTTMQPNAKFLVKIHGLPPLSSAVRFNAWIDAIATFRSAPFVGRGPGLDTVHTYYFNPTDPVTHPQVYQYVNDAHNLYLNVAAEFGIAGIALALAITAYVTRKMIKAVVARREQLFGLSAAFVSCFAVQGLVGSFEDTRSMWVLLGLVLFADRMDVGPSETAREPSAPGSSP